MGSSASTLASWTRLPERQLHTLILLESLFDHLPRSIVRILPTPSGVVPSDEHPCGLCNRTGRVQRASRPALCPQCGGEGWRKRRAGEPYYDRYTGEQVGTEEDGSLRCMTIQEIERDLEKIRSDFEARNGLSPSRDFGWIARHRALRRAGSYDDLERALQSLLATHPRQARAIWHQYVLQFDFPADGKEELIAEGLRLLTERMPNPILVPRWLLPDGEALKRSYHYGKTHRHEKARGERNEEIRKQYASGVSTSALAVRHNLTRRSVQRIVRAA